MARSLAFLCAGAPGPARITARYSASMRWRSRSHATRASKVSPPCSSPIRYAETQNCCSAARKRCGRQVTPILEDDKKRWRGFISPPVSLSRTRDLSGCSQTFTSPIKDLIRSFDPNTISHRQSTRKGGFEKFLKNLRAKKRWWWKSLPATNAKTFLRIQMILQIGRSRVVYHTLTCDAGRTRKFV